MLDPREIDNGIPGRYTGSSIAAELRQPWGDYSCVWSYEIGALDAPEWLAAGSMLRYDFGGTHQRLAWRN